MKNKVLIISVVVVTLVSAIGFSLYKVYKYRQSDEYTLKKIGYSESEIIEVMKLKKEDRNTILGLEYDKDMVGLFKERFFILSNLNRYLSYKKSKENIQLDEVIGVVNVNADKDFYSTVINTDMEKNELILVNKFNKLADDYSPDDLVEMGLQYAFSGKLVRKIAYDNFRVLVNDAKKEGLVIVANSTFRDYTYQDGLYSQKESNEGKDAADSYVARPGHSEHQTGLSIDVSTLNSTLAGFEETPEFAWLAENAYRYGFILRYPKGKEHITGYSYESWHYRYVGADVAKEIHDLGITFDEYYAYYLND